MSLDWLGWFFVGAVAGSAVTWKLVIWAKMAAFRNGSIHTPNNCPAARKAHDKMRSVMDDEP